MNGLRIGLVMLAVHALLGCTDGDTVDGGGTTPVDAAVLDAAGLDAATLDARTDDAAAAPSDTGVPDSGASDDATAPAEDATASAEDATAPAEDATAPAEDATVAGDSGPTDAACTATGAEVCGDDLDNDCNGFVDDVDTSQDGLTDCARIALMGNAGSNGSSDFVAWLRSNGVVVDRVHTVATASITPSFLTRYDVLILDRLVRDYTPAEADLVHAWLYAGGGLISLTGYSGGATDLSRPGSILAPLGASYVAGLRSQDVTQFVPHATTSSLSSVTFSGGFRVAAGPVGTSTAVYVASIADGPVALAIELGSGRAFVWGDEWVTFDSEWRQRPDIRRFWVNVLGWVERVR